MTEESMNDDSQLLRILEAMLFAASEPLTEATMASRLPEGTDIPCLLEELSGHYANRGVNLIRVGSKWALRTASDVAPALRLETEVPSKLSQAALETLAIIAYHQPVTRAEIEEIRGKALSLASDFLDFRARHRLVIGNDGQGFQGRLRKLAGHFGLQTQGRGHI